MIGAKRAKLRVDSGRSRGGPRHRTATATTPVIIALGAVITTGRSTERRLECPVVRPAASVGVRFRSDAEEAAQISGGAWQAGPEALCCRRPRGLGCGCRLGV